MVSQRSQQARLHSEQRQQRSAGAQNSCKENALGCVCALLTPEFSVEEYNETKAETLDQLREFQAFLERSLRGDMTLVTEFGTAQLVTQNKQQRRQIRAKAKRDAHLAMVIMEGATDAKPAIARRIRLFSVALECASALASPESILHIGG